MNRYVIYNFEDISKMNNNDPKNITEIIEAGNNYYKFNLQNIPPQQNKIVIAVSSLTNTNNESSLAVIYILNECLMDGMLFFNTGISELLIDET